MDKRALILGIESSCDETAAALVRGGSELVSSVVASQIATHSPYGGVVPELASREHLRNLVPVTRAALAKAGVTYEDVDAVAVTNGPGLAGALLTGVSFAKSLAWALEKPLIAVNHIEGHIHAVLLERRQNGAGVLEFPVLALVVSGGHTHLFLAEQRSSTAAADAGWHYENIGHTRDDAAGEAFDKTAKLLGLGYPGGPIIDRISKFGDPTAVKFTFAQFKHPARNESKRAGRIERDRKRFDFSYSGIKTAVLRYVETHEMFSAIAERRHALLQIARPPMRITRCIATADPRSGCQLPGGRGGRPDAADAGGVPGVWGANPAGHRRSGRQQRLASQLAWGRRAARPAQCRAGSLPFAHHVHRQRRHDRRSRLSKVDVEGVRRAGIIGRGKPGAALNEEH